MSTHLASSAQALGQVATVASDPFPESWGQAQASSEFAVPQLPLSRTGQSRAAQLMGILGGLRRAQVPLPRAARCPGVTAALHRDAEMRRLWVFWCLSTSPRQTGRAAAPRTPAARSPGRCLHVSAWHSPQCPDRRGCSHGTARTLPAVPEPRASPVCSWGFVPAQHIGVSAASSRPQPHSPDGEEQGGSSRYF